MQNSIKRADRSDEFVDSKRFRIQMQKEHILQKLKEKGYRLTKQRVTVIDIILKFDCCSCKEILYRTSKINKSIGSATIYRTLNMLEEIGAIHRRSIYEFSALKEEGVLVILENGSELHLSSEEWNKVTQKGLEICGYLNGEKIISIEHAKGF